MALVTITNLGKSYGIRRLFHDVSLFVSEQERVALIGDNGTGKTTLLRILAGEETADSGNISTMPGISIGYLPQEVDLPDTVALHLAVMGVTPELLSAAIEMEEIERQMSGASGEKAHELGNKYAEATHKFDTLHGFDYQINAKIILLGLGFDAQDLDKPIQSLSGGQKTRAALARLLLLSPDLLLLDEPTNHLDIQACDWLQEFLQNKYQGAALIVSHDRYFLDAVVGKVVEIEYGTAFSYQGNYSAFAQQKAANIEEQQKLYKLQQKEIARIETAIQTLFSNRKFSRRDNKVKQLERIHRVKSTSEQRTIKVQAQSALRSGREVIKIDGIAKSFPDKDLFNDIDFIVARGHKIGIVGPNGSGKTTLLRIIAGRIEADCGEVIFGSNVEPVYFAQEFDHLVRERTVLEELLADAELTAGQARDLLAQFLFMGDDAFKKVEVLSGGEQCRLALAKVLANGPNLLLLDEPTNHLDIKSREALEDALKAFNGTMLVASHDRYLLDAVASEIVEIKDGAWKHYLGNYSDYRAKTKPVDSPAINERTIKRKAPIAPPKRPDSPLRAKQRLQRELSKQQKELEISIEQIEKRMHELTSELANEDNYRNGSAGELSQEYNDLSAKLESTYAAWEEVCKQTAEIELD